VKKITESLLKYVCENGMEERDSGNSGGEDRQ